MSPLPGVHGVSEAQNDPQFEKHSEPVTSLHAGWNADGLDGKAAGTSFDSARLWARSHVESLRNIRVAQDFRIFFSAA